MIYQCDKRGGMCKLSLPLHIGRQVSIEDGGLDMCTQVWNLKYQKYIL